jgi:hypothetical protein
MLVVGAVKRLQLLDTPIGTRRCRRAHTAFGLQLQQRAYQAAITNPSVVICGWVRAWSTEWPHPFESAPAFLHPVLGGV